MDENPDKAEAFAAAAGRIAEALDSGDEATREIRSRSEGGNMRPGSRRHDETDVELGRECGYHQ